MHTDAIWRACRIILDVRMHRGELSVEEATDFLVEQTSFERANARGRGPAGTPTARPTRCRYLLGRTLLLELRADEQRRLGDALLASRRFHDTLLRNGSLPISFHRRLLAGEGADRDRAGHPGHRPRGRAARGSSSGPAPRPAIGAPTDRPDRIAERFVALGARLIHLVDFDGARAGRAGQPRGGRRDRGPGRRPAPGRRRRRRPTAIRLAFAAGATRVVLTTAIADRPDDLRACLAVAGDWLAVGLDPRPERLAAFPWRRAAPPTVEALVGELVGAGVAPVRPEPRRRRAGPRAHSRSLVRSYDAEILVAGGVRDLDGLAPPARHRRRRRHPRRGAPLRGHRLPAALEAAA